MKRLAVSVFLLLLSPINGFSSHTLAEQTYTSASDKLPPNFNQDINRSLPLRNLADVGLSKESSCDENRISQYKPVDERSVNFICETSNPQNLLAKIPVFDLDKFSNLKEVFSYSPKGSEFLAIVRIKTELFYVYSDARGHLIVVDSKKPDQFFMFDSDVESPARFFDLSRPSACFVYGQKGIINLEDQFLEIDPLDDYYPELGIDLFSVAKGLKSHLKSRLLCKDSSFLSLSFLRDHYVAIGGSAIALIVGSFLWDHFMPQAPSQAKASADLSGTRSAVSDESGSKLGTDDPLATRRTTSTFKSVSGQSNQIQAQGKPAPKAPVVAQSALKEPVVAQPAPRAPVALPIQQAPVDQPVAAQQLSGEALRNAITALKAEIADRERTAKKERPVKEARLQLLYGLREAEKLARRINAVDQADD